MYRFLNDEDLCNIVGGQPGTEYQLIITDVLGQGNVPDTAAATAASGLVGGLITGFDQSGQEALLNGIINGIIP